MSQAENIKETAKRPPVVVVLGHVDHGKTTLLDYIRKTNVAAKEAGGITQSIGSYKIFHKGRGVTFIDTPGHEAFFRMRSRGVKLADLAILVVAADDGVQPQTKEAIKIINEAKIPFVVAINKIDKQTADINKVKNELTAEGVLLEGYGGSVSFQPISGKTGEGVPELLDLILLAADLEDLPMKREAPPKGFVLESKMDSRRGILVSVIIKEGVLKIGDLVATVSAKGKVKGLEDFLGKRIKEVAPAEPALISGFEALPQAGEELLAGAAAAAQVVKAGAKKTAGKQRDGSEDYLNVILKADVAGSLEALAEVLKKSEKPENLKLRIVGESLGEITDGDVKLAISTKAIIIGFRIKANKAALNLADSHRIKIVTSEIVYELAEALTKEFKEFAAHKVSGDLEVLAVFGAKQNSVSKKAKEQIVGGRVIEGEIVNNAQIDIVRRGAVLGTGRILNLQQAKKDAQRVEAGNECGLLIEAEVMIKESDHLILR